MSLHTNKYANNIPIVERYIDNKFDTFVYSGNYNEDIKNFNYFVLDPDFDDNKPTSYILRVYTNIKNYQVFACAAGGPGGLIYGSGGSGGNYLYIDNVDNNATNATLKSGSYLITPGRSINLANEPNLFTTINNNININGNFYLIKYAKNDFINYLGSIKNIDNYKQRDWSKNNNVSGSIISITNQDKIIEPSKVVELIFYLKKNTSFKFNNFQNLYYTRIIKINNSNNINTLYIPDSNNNYLYTAGNNDEMITIICYQNTNDTLSIDKIPSWTSLFDYTYANRYSANFYINDFMSSTNKKDNVNRIKDTINGIINSNTKTYTSICYNNNPDASLSELIGKNEYSLQGGITGNICSISYNDGVNTNYMLKRFYMPSLFALSINLQGGSPGSTTTGGNTVINNLGGNKSLPSISGKNISVNNKTSEWYSGIKGYYSKYFKLYAYYPYDANVELNNTSLANGGYTGYWQFLKDEIDYKYGANGLNDLTSPNYGTYGCGGQGGSVLLDKNSNFTGSRGKNGVFILSFVNQALATIVNDNSLVLKKMVNLFMKIDDTNHKLSYLNNLINDNSNLVSPNDETNNYGKIINNLFIHKANIQLDDKYLDDLNTYIPKSNFNNLLAVIHIIHRIYYVIANYINDVNNDIKNITNVKKINIAFVADTKLEKIVAMNNSDTLFVYVCDNIISSYIKKYLKNYNNYHSILNLPDNINITIIKENSVITDITSSKPETNEYTFIIKTISYIFDIEPKDYKININVIQTTYNIFCLNSVIYAIIYNQTILTETTVNIVYKELKDYNYEIKKVTDNIVAHNNIFEEQNEFKLYFNNGINDYNNYYDKNNDFRNLLTSKKAYTLTKEKFKNTVNIFTLIMFIIVVIIIIWIVYVIVFNSNQFDAMPHLVLMLFILIIIIVIMNYYNYSYDYKEFFANSLDNATQLIIYDDTNDYIINEVSFNNEKYKITYIKKTSGFLLYKNLETSIVLIGKGANIGAGGTINIYDKNFVNTNIKENQKYYINFNDGNIINISETSNAVSNPNDLFKINPRLTGINANNNINIYYNNTSNNLSSNSPSLLDYYDKQLFPLTDVTVNSNNSYNFYSNVSNNNYSTLSNIDNIANIPNDITSNLNIKEILSVLFSTNNSSSLYYGSSGGTKDYNDVLINSNTNYLDAYGLGGMTEPLSLPIDGVCIIINKQIEYTPVHLDLQTLINMFNNNINKLIYDNFNKIYLIDNNVIYNNALIAYRKRYNEENIKNDKYKKFETNINDYSTNILMDVYFRFELTKLSIYILTAMVISLIVFYFNKQHFILILTLFILMVVLIVIFFYYNMRLNTRRDYYKYYWSKYNNDN